MSTLMELRERLVGDERMTRSQVMTLPNGSSIIDVDGDEWTRTVNGWRTTNYPNLDDGDLDEFAPFTLIPMADWERELLAGPDPVLKPTHYTAGKIEVIDAIEDWGLDKHAYLKDVVKYVARHEHKANPIEDLKKAHAYLTRHINRLHGIASWEKEW